MRVFRITRRQFGTPETAFSGIGVTLAAGRWNWKRPDIRGVYTSDSLALACLETLVHLRSRPRVFPGSVYWTAEVPDVLIERAKDLPKGWDGILPNSGARDLGTQFLITRHVVGLALPTAVQAQGLTVLLNPQHPAFRMDWVAGPFPYEYDRRLS